MISIDFDKFNKTGLKQILAKIEKEGLTVSDVQGDNKAKRESGYQVKTATLTFESGQKLVLKAKAGGSIYQVRLNNKVLPIKHYDDLDKAVLEIIDYVQGNEKSYQKQKERQEARQKVTVPKVKPVNTSIADQINTFQQAVDDTRGANEELIKQIAEADTVNAEKNRTVGGLTTEFDSLVAEGEALQAEYDSLKEAA